MAHQRAAERLKLHGEMDSHAPPFPYSLEDQKRILAELDGKEAGQQRRDSPPSSSGGRRESGGTISPPRRVPPYAPFPLTNLPPILREYTDASSAAIGCDPALVA